MPPVPLSIANSSKYFPAILDYYRKLPLNVAMKQYQQDLFTKIQQIRQEVASDPERFNTLPPAIAQAALAKEKRIRDREEQWQNVLQEFKNSLSASPRSQFRRQNEPWERELSAKAHELSQVKAQKKAAVFVEHLSRLQFIRGEEDWKAAIEYAFDNPVTHDDAQISSLIAKRDRVEGELNAAFVQEMKALVSTIAGQKE